MTLPTTIDQNIYAGNDVTTIFAYTFKILDETHLRVVVSDTNDVETLLTLTTHYTISGVGDIAGGNLTTVDLTAICGQTNLPTGWKISIRRVVPQTQLTDLENQGGYEAEIHETVFDYLTMLIQQLQNEVDRCPKATETSEIDPDDLLSALIQYAANAEISATAAAVSETNAAASAVDAADSAIEAASYVGNWRESTVDIKTSNYIITSSDRTKILVASGTFPKIFTMPDIIGNEIYKIRNYGSGVLTITPDVSDTTEITTLSLGQAVIFFGDGTNNKWRAIAQANVYNYGITDEKIKISSDDTTASYLENKITSTSSSITLTTLNPAGDEKLNLEVSSDFFNKTIDDTDDINEGSTNKFLLANTVGTGQIKTSTGSASGSISATSAVYIAMTNSYVFFPNTYIENSDRNTPFIAYNANNADETARFGLGNNTGSPLAYSVRWRYITASDENHWIYILKENGIIKHVWESTDHCHAIEGHPFGQLMPNQEVYIIKDEQSLMNDIIEKRKLTKKSLAQIIYDDYIFDTDINWETRYIVEEDIYNEKQGEIYKNNPNFKKIILMNIPANLGYGKLKKK